jgi:hypothetical protein
VIGTSATNTVLRCPGSTGLGTLVIIGTWGSTVCWNQTVRTSCGLRIRKSHPGLGDFGGTYSTKKEPNYLESVNLIFALKLIKNRYSLEALRSLRGIRAQSDQQPVPEPFDLLTFLL